MDTDEASIPTEPERTTNEPNKSIIGTTLKREVCTETCVTKLSAEHIKSIPRRKKPRLQASLPAIVAGADTLNASPDAIVAAPVASPDAGTDPVTASPMQRNGGATQASHHRWTPEEDNMLTSAVKETCKKKHGEEYRTDWAAISALVPGRTKQQCLNRWRSALDSKSDETIARVGKWTTVEYSTLEKAVEKHNGKDWAAISALVPDRTKTQCWHRWNNALDSKSDETIARAGKWTADEDSMLKDAVEKHNGKDWAAISELVPGRTKTQCWHRWHGALDSKSDETIARVGEKWTKEEDSTLKDAVEKHNGKDWTAISALVPGRTKQQCMSRWYGALDSKGDATTAHVGRWTKDEDGKLMDAAEKHNGEDWAAISELVLGRSKTQCWQRWHDCLRSKTDKTPGRVGKWTKEEDGTLKDAVVKHNGEDWAAISALVPGRSKRQCQNRWHNEFRSKGDETTAHAGKWTTGEDGKLKDAVEKHNGKDWIAISALVPGRTSTQCRNRWVKYLLAPSHMTITITEKEKCGPLKKRLHWDRIA
jgi:hypothetical protein